MAIVTVPSGSATTNEETVDAIIENIEQILTGLGFPIEDLSGDSYMSSPWAQVHYNGEDFENEYSQRPEYNQVNLVLFMQFQSNTPALSRGLQVKTLHDLRDAITVATVNVGDLRDSKLVTFVQHTGGTVDYNAPITAISYALAVQYREV